MVINGENYHALQALVYAYQGMVDCIYIDPPFNSGAKDWKYNNNYVGKDDIYKHSKWLTFMEDRLKLAKKLLNPKKSVLIVAIDENELHRLSILLEQIFPAAKIQMVTVLINPAGASIILGKIAADAKQVSSAIPTFSISDITDYSAKRVEKRTWL